MGAPRALKPLIDLKVTCPQVSEGFDVLDRINEVFVDEEGRPLQNIRIRHTIILDDPFDDPPQVCQQHCNP